MMVVVQSARNSSTLSEDIQTNALKPDQTCNIKDPYVTTYLKADLFPLTFVIGDGKEYHSETEKHFNQPLKENSSYIVFLRFFESKDSYYSTEWSSSVITMVKFPVECVRDDNKSRERSSDDKIPMDLSMPLIIVSLCFLVSLGVNIYQRRLIQNINRQASRKVQTLEVKENTLNDDTEPVYEMPNEVLEYNERNETGATPKISAGQETSVFENGDIIEIYTIQEPSEFETGNSLEIHTFQEPSAFETGDRPETNAIQEPSAFEDGPEIYTIQEPSTFETTDKPEISTAQEPSAYVSLNDNKDPANVYQSLQLPGMSADPHHTFDQASIHMSLKENREPGNSSQLLQPSGTSAHPTHSEEGGQLEQTLMKYENPAFDANFGGI